MNFLDLMRARRKSGKTPTLEKRRWTDVEQERIAKGLCVTCGVNPSSMSSFICGSCESVTTIEDIRSEIEQARRRILGR